MNSPGSPSQSKSPLKCVVERMIEQRVDATLLAVCPNSDAVTRAAVRSAAKNNAPLLFAATLNQVDTDGGYTGWTPDELMAAIGSAASSDRARQIPIFVGLDHAGPWTRDRYRTRRITIDSALARARESIAACLSAGYHLIHVDATIDPTVQGLVPVPVMAERTIALIAFSEEQRIAERLPPVAYEVGTEEVRSGANDLERFETFVGMLAEALEEAHLMHAWPTFFVGALGTELHTTRFDESMAARMAAMVREYGSAIKGHYTDYVDHPDRYPAARIGGANIGPEFADAELAALRSLVVTEKKLGRESGFERVLSDAVIGSGRWRKWLTPDERGCASFDLLTHDRRDWLIRTGSRYVWTKDDVVEARSRLYDNVATALDPDEHVIGAIERSIDRYVNAFNLAGLAPRVSDWATSD